MKDTLRVGMKPDWNEIERTSDQGRRFLEARSVPAPLAESMYMVISELFENSLKYGVYAAASDRVMLSVRVTRTQITVEVTNHFDQSCREHLDTLDRLIQWIRGHQDPFAAYLEKLREVSSRPLQDETSGLGLARIAYEGGAILDFFVDEKNLLNVSAVSARE